MNTAARLAGATALMDLIGKRHPAYTVAEEFLTRYEPSVGTAACATERLVGTMALLRHLRLKGFAHLGEARSITNECLKEIAPESEVECGKRRSTKSRGSDSVSGNGKSAS